MHCACRKKYKNKKIPNEQPAFSCQPAFVSHSQSLTKKLFSLFFFVSLSCASRKRYFFHLFFIFFCHFRPCKRMRKHVFAGRNTQHIFSNYKTGQFSRFTLYNHIRFVHEKKSRFKCDLCDESSTQVSDIMPCLAIWPDVSRYGAMPRDIA